MIVIWWLSEAGKKHYKYGKPIDLSLKASRMDQVKYRLKLMLKLVYLGKASL